MKTYATAQLMFDNVLKDASKLLFAERNNVQLRKIRIRRN